MPIITQKLASFAAVDPGSTASVKLPVTVTYAAIDIQIKHDGALMSLADMKTKIKRIRLMIDGHALWNMTGKTMVEYNDFYGLNAADGLGILSLVFAAGYLDNPSNEDALALGTADLTNVTIEIELAADIVAPVLEGTAQIYSGANTPVGRMIRLEDTHYSNSGTGIFEIADLPVVGAGVGLKALHFTTDKIDTIEIKANQNTLFDMNKQVNQSVLDRRTKRTMKRTPQAGYWHIDISANRLADLIATEGFRDFRIKAKMTEAGSFAVIHETVVPVKTSI